MSKEKFAIKHKNQRNQMLIWKINPWILNQFVLIHRIYKAWKWLSVNFWAKVHNVLRMYWKISVSTWKSVISGQHLLLNQHFDIAIWMYQRKIRNQKQKSTQLNAFPKNKSVNFKWICSNSPLLQSLKVIIRTFLDNFWTKETLTTYLEIVAEFKNKLKNRCFLLKKWT